MTWSDHFFCQTLDQVTSPLDQNNGDLRRGSTWIATGITLTNSDGLTPNRQRISIHIQVFILVGGIPTPLKNMKVSWDYYYSQ
jgi:hypothetical protein